MQKDISKFLAPKYNDLIRGLNLTPEQDQELKKLYKRATVSVRPWGFVFAGVIAADFYAGLYTLIKSVETNHSHDGIWYFAFLGAQVVALLVYAERMTIANKKLLKRIDEIKQQNIR